MVGAGCTSGSALGAATALLALRSGVAPAVGNLDEPVPDLQLDLVRTPRPMELRTVLVVARGHGGFNTSIVFRG